MAHKKTARTRRNRAECQVTAWAAGGGDRPVEVASPDLGRVRLAATACGVPP
jgi:hypothetical protein